MCDVGVGGAEQKMVLVMVESPAFGKEGLEDLSRLDR